MHCIEVDCMTTTCCVKEVKHCSQHPFETPHNPQVICTFPLSPKFHLDWH